MRRDEFVARVREIGELGSSDEAERAIEATLQTLKERLAGNEPGNLGASSPGTSPNLCTEGAVERTSRSPSSTAGSARRRAWAKPRPSAKPGPSPRVSRRR